MKLEAFSQRFRNFVCNSEKYTDEQRAIILESFEYPRNKKIFNVSVILMLWSFVALFVDTTLIGGGLVAGFTMGFNLTYFLPAFLFFVINAVAKVIFVRHYMKRDISYGCSAYAAVPYAGSVLILGHLLSDNKLLLRSFLSYLSQARKRLWRKQS